MRYGYAVSHFCLHQYLPDFYLQIYLIFQFSACLHNVSINELCDAAYMK